MAKKHTKHELDMLEQLKSSNEMFVKSIKEAEAHGNEKSVAKLKEAREDILADIAKIDANIEKECRAMLVETIESEDIGEILSSLTNERKMESVYDVLAKEEARKDTFEESDDDNVEVETFVTKSGVDTDTVEFNDIDEDIQYDVIQLPSNGECYKHKKNRVPVAYLTAYDENLLTSPNLYKDGLIIDFLLKHKVIDKEINIDDLCEGDADAIVLFLRLTSYGEEFPVTVTDPDTKQEFSTTIDLNTLKYKEFNLKADENGLFDFTLPISNDTVKFSFLTRRDVKNLELLSKIDDNGVKADLMKSNIKYLKQAINSEAKIARKVKENLVKDLDKYVELANKIGERTSTPFSKSITNRMEIMIKAVNGNSDKEYIAKYVKHMGARDALMFRRYVLENEPGVDFEVEIERPESLGGGSFKTFLEWDESVFFNIA